MTDLPALLGGTPVFPAGPPPWPPSDSAIRAALDTAFESGIWGQYHPETVAALERRLAEWHAVPHALTCASGTLAVEVALRALRVGPGDEVILAAYDYGANFLSIHAVGATPVLVDVAANNWNLAVDRVAAAVEPATKAIIASHLHGGIVPMSELMAVAAHHRLAVIEDAAQAAGAFVQGQAAGSWGDVGVLSFGGSKLLAAGRGGAILARDAAVFQRARLALLRGVQQWAALSGLQAAVLVPQLDALADQTRRRAAAVARLVEHLGEVPGLTPFVNSVDAAPAFYKVGFRYDADVFGLPRARFVAALRAEGVAFDEGFRALHRGRAAGRFRAAGELTEADRAHAGCVVLHHPVLLSTEADLAGVATAVRRTYLNAARLRG